MNILRHLRTLLRRESTATGTLPRTGGMSVFVPGGDAMAISTVYRCVNLLADSVAALPMRYMRRKDGIMVEDGGSRLQYLLGVQPCSYLSAVDFWRQVVQYMLLRGNAYIVPMYDAFGNGISRLALADPSCVVHDGLNETYTIQDMYAGISGTFREPEVIHIKNYSRDGRDGLSVLGYARSVLDITRAGDSETLKRFVSGGNVRGFVSNDTSVRGFGEYQDKELEKAAADLTSRIDTGERFVALPGQAQMTQFSLTSADMQFLETRKFSVREICRFFGVHPSFVFDDTSNNYKSAEMANVAYLSNTLNPILRRIENELQRKLVPESLAGERVFQFDRRGLYACDLDSRVKYQTQTIAAGIYTVNEWRREENKPSVKGGDRVMVSANLKGIDENVNSYGQG